MTTHIFNTIPFWLTHPTNLQNVIYNQLASLKEVPSFIHLPNKSLFTSGLRQAIYWKKRLSPSVTNNTVIFTFLGSQGLIFPNVIEVCQALGNVCDITNIIEIYRATNPNFLGISFNNHIDASKVRNTFNYYKDSIVIHVPSASPLVHHFKLLWLPPLFPDSRIHHFFNKHAVKHSFTRDTILTKTNTHTPSNSVSGSFELSPHNNIDKLPHLIPLPAPHLGNAFLIISGRSPFCLRCGQVGHVRRTCSAPRCTTCHRYHSSSSPCTSCDPALHAALPDSSLFEDPDSASSLVLAADDAIPLTSTLVPIPCDSNKQPAIDASLLTSSTSVSSSSTHITENNNDYAFVSITTDTPISNASTPCSTSDSAIIVAPDLNDNPLPIAKRVTRSMTSRILPTVPLSNDNSSVHTNSTNHSTIYHLLPDEVDNIPNDSSLTCSYSSVPLPSIDDNTASALPPASPQSSTPMHTRKKLRTSSSPPIVPPVTHESTTNPPTSNWADQVEQELPPPFISLSSDALRACPPFTPHSVSDFLPIPGLSESFCVITCFYCHTTSQRKWPEFHIGPCPRCSRTYCCYRAGIPIFDSTMASAVVSLSDHDYHLPSSIAYLQKCLKLRTRLKPP